MASGQPFRHQACGVSDWSAVFRPADWSDSPFPAGCLGVEGSRRTAKLALRVGIRQQRNRAFERGFDVLRQGGRADACGPRLQACQKFRQLAARPPRYARARRIGRHCFRRWRGLPPAHPTLAPESVNMLAPRRLGVGKWSQCMARNKSACAATAVGHPGLPSVTNTSCVRVIRTR